MYERLDSFRGDVVTISPANVDHNTRTSILAVSSQSHGRKQRTLAIAGKFTRIKKNPTPSLDLMHRAYETTSNNAPLLEESQ